MADTTAALASCAARAAAVRAAVDAGAPRRMVAATAAAVASVLFGRVRRHPAALVAPAAGDAAGGQGEALVPGLCRFGYSVTFSPRKMTLLWKKHHWADIRNDRGLLLRAENSRQSHACARRILYCA